MAAANPTRGTGILEGFLARARARKANALIPRQLRSGRILDVGCGQVPLFLRETDFEEKYGIERVPQPHSSEDINLIALDLTAGSSLPFEHESFDVITMLAVLEHIDRDKVFAIVDEVHRVLKSNGAFVLTTPASWTDPLLRAMARLRLVSPEEIDEHSHSYSRRDLTDLFAKTNFKDGHVRSGHFELGMNNWAVARKAS